MNDGNERLSETVDEPPTDAADESQLACVRVSGRLIRSGGFFTPPHPDRWVRCVKGLPEDAEYVRMWMDHAKDELVVVYRHPSFRAVPAGCELPSLEVCYASYTREGVSQVVAGTTSNPSANEEREVRRVQSDILPTHEMYADWGRVRAVVDVRGGTPEEFERIADYAGKWLRGEVPVLVLSPGARLRLIEIQGTAAGHVQEPAGWIADDMRAIKAMRTVLAGRNAGGAPTEPDADAPVIREGGP